MTKNERLMMIGLAKAVSRLTTVITKGLLAQDQSEEYDAQRESIEQTMESLNKVTSLMQEEWGENEKS